jgi:heme/copper-type cytochrome/quinol oxidase subunit 3
MTVPVSDRVVIDVSALPKVAFGKRSLSWWATAGFIAVEGTTLAVLLTSYLYLRTNANEWPPPFIAPPDVLYPSLNLAVIVLAVLPAMQLKKRAHALDRGGVTRWLLVMTIFSAVACALRALEFGALNVRWDVNAYGSALWGVYASHTLLLVTDLLESAVMTFFFATGRNTRRFYSDAEDAADYQYFLSAAWVVCYLLLIIGPRSFL